MSTRKWTIYAFYSVSVDVESILSKSESESIIRFIHIMVLLAHDIYQPTSWDELDKDKNRQPGHNLPSSIWGRM